MSYDDDDDEHKLPWAEAYLCTKWHLDASSRLATIEMGRKLENCGGGSAPFFGAWARFPSNIKSPWMRPTSVPTTILIYPAVWPQQTWADFFGGGLSPFFGEGERVPI